MNLDPNKKILLTGVKPTGRPHIANYFGAMKQPVDLQEDFNTWVMVADLHALNTTHNPEDLRSDALNLVIDYLAIGLDPKKVRIFKQSGVPAHAELTWMFDAITTVAYLERAHAFKDAQAKKKDITVGTFNYPMLMAADILLYNTDVVPVGLDQKQHIEYARDTAEKFNHLFGETFKLPQPLIMKEVGNVPGLDGQKMSKSYKNTIPLFAEDAEITKLAMSVVTDSRGANDPKDPATCNIFALHKLVSGEELAELEERYLAGTISYKESKEILAKNLVKFITPLREARKSWEGRLEEVHAILEEGTRLAKEESDRKIAEVKAKVGFNY